MAVNNSIALGKTKGSIGNVTFARLKGQQVSKSKIEAKGAILPANQSPAQIQMKNVVMAYQVIALFLQFATGLRKSTESIFNAFVRIFKSTMLDALQPTGWIVLQNLNGKVISSGNFIKPYVTNISAVTAIIILGTGGAPFVANSYINLLKFVSATGVNSTFNHLITEAEWYADTLTIPSALVDTDSVFVYAYNIASKKCSEPAFSA